MGGEELSAREIILPVSKLEAVIVEGDGHSDRLLLKRNKRVDELIPDYLASMTKSLGAKQGVTRDDIQDLLLPDSEYLAVEIYRLNYGEIFDFRYRCSGCNKTIPGDFPLKQLPFMELALEFQGNIDPTVTVTLPRSGLSVVVGMLNGHKEELITNQAAQSGLDLNQADYQSLRSIDGKTEFSFEEVIRLKLRDHKAIRKARNRLLTGYDTTIIACCGICETKTSINMLLHKDFLLPEG
jgi:hypothetical protein